MTYDISPELAAEAQRQLQHPALKTTLLGQLGRDARNPPELDTKIHPACQMLNHSLRAHQDAALSVSQYFAIALQQYHTAAEVLRRLERTVPAPNILDFACGYGRLLNLLIHRVPTERIWASEIQTDAVAFAVRQFGVHGLQSTPAPEDFNPEQRFDLIWVVSLFSHLPPGLFERWLKRLAGLLTPDGILLFTVHDQGLLPPDRTMPDSGVLYIGSSENRDLNPEIYGTTFVNEDFVRQAICDQLGEQRRYLRLPRLINFEQDAYLIGGTDDRDLGEFESLSRGLRGWVDGFHISDGRLRMHGWAGSMDQGEPVQLAISLDGQAQPFNSGEPRPDVVEVLGKPSLKNSGWSAQLQLPTDRDETYLRITLSDDRDQQALIYAGALDLNTIRA